MATKRQRQRKHSKYPRKLRHTLERISEKKDADESDDGLQHTLWRDFFAGKQMVEFMHGLIDDSPVDERHHRLIITHRLKVNQTRVRPPRPFSIRPPWKVKHETPGSDD
jgi:hypothetical protein